MRKRIKERNEGVEVTKDWEKRYFELLNNYSYVDKEYHEWWGRLAIWKQLQEIQTEIESEMVYLYLKINEEGIEIYFTESWTLDFDGTAGVGRLFKNYDLGLTLALALDTLETNIRWAEYIGEEEEK